MNTTTMAEYNKAKRAFASAHGQVVTEKEDTSGSTHIKQISFVDGAVWYETSKIIFENITGEVHGVPYEFRLMLHRVEYWNSDNTDSAYAYEKATKEHL